MIYIARKKICNFEFMYIIEQCNTGLFFFFLHSKVKIIFKNILTR